MSFLTKISQLLSQSYNWLNTRPSGLQSVIIITLVTCGVLITYSIIGYGVEKRSLRMLEPYVMADSIIYKQIQGYEKPFIFPVSKYKFIKSQYEFIQKRKRTPHPGSLIFLKNSYATILILMTLSTIGGLLLFVLVSRGWLQAGIQLKSLFFGILMCAMYYGLFPQVFKQEANYKHNFARYLDYSRTQNNIARQFSELSVPKIDSIVYDSVPNTNPTEFLFKPDTSFYFNAIDTAIFNNYKRINELTDFILTIDGKEVKSINEMSAIFGESGKAKRDTTIN